MKLRPCQRELHRPAIWRSGVSTTNSCIGVTPLSAGRNSATLSDKTVCSFADQVPSRDAQRSRSAASSDATSRSYGRLPSSYDRREDAGGQGPVPGACAAAAAPTRSRATARATPMRIARRCHPGAIQRRWTPERVLDAMRAWQTLYGRLPSSYDWSRTHARRSRGEALRRLNVGEWPSASVVSHLFGTWAAARTAAVARGMGTDVRR